MFWQTLLTTGVLLTSAAAAPHVLHEKRGQPWRKYRSPVNADAIIPVRIALTQSNLETGYDRLMDVSHPASPNYGKHLTAEEVHDIFAPSAETLNAVTDWLVESGVNASDIVPYKNKGWLSIDMKTKDAERLFRTKYYEHHSADSVKIGCDAYYLPAHVSPHVDFIKPGVKFSAPVKKRTVEKRGTVEKRWGGPGQKGRPPKMPAHSTPGWSPPSGSGGLPADLLSCTVNITPTCIEALYDLPQPDKRPKSTSVDVMGLYETYDTFAVADIDLFFSNFAPWVPQSAVPAVVSVDGGEAPVAASSVQNGGESDIDLDLSTSLIYPQKVQVYQVDDLPVSSGEQNNTGFLNEFLDAVDGSYCDYTAYGITGDSPGIDPTYPDTLPGGYKGALECGTYSLTRVVSVSYGEMEYAFPKNYVERQCNEFMKLGLQGHSFFVASGDYGVASFPGSDDNAYGCLSANGQNATIYNPDYPVGCPYITAVGATRMYPEDTVNDVESAMQVNLTAYNTETGAGSISIVYQYFASGGGFSNFFSPPSYQSSQVANYLEKYAPSEAAVPYYYANADASNVGANGGVYNRGGRGYPDVAANGAFLLAFNNETLEHWFGTSLASPIFGSAITMINEERTAVGKGPVGFVNAVLYEHPEVFHDVVNGSNPNCGSEGFTTAPGWDPVSGLGTPNYPKMLELFLSLP